MKKGYVKITMDVPQEVRFKIRIAAAANDRTPSAEIRETLQQVYGDKPEPKKEGGEI